MARLKKTYAALPTHKLRNMVWARAVKHDLLPDSDPHRPHAHLICNALSKRREEGGRPSLGSFFTPTRWLDWWQGSHPTSGKFLEIDSLVKGSSRWFEPHISEQDEHPLHTLLYAMDLLGNPVSELAAFEVLLSMQKKWGAKSNTKANFMWDGAWYSPQFPDAKMPNEIATHHYSSLAPASILRYMLWIGDAMRIDQLPQHKAWVFDLVSATLCIYSLYRLSGDDSALFSGVDGDVAAMVLRSFTRMNCDINDALFKEEATRMMKTSLGIINRNASVLPDSELMLEMMVSSMRLFTIELAKYGILVTDVDCRDSGYFLVEPLQ